MGQAGGSASPRSLSKAAPAEGLGSCPRPSQQQTLCTTMPFPEALQPPARAQEGKPRALSEGRTATGLPSACSSVHPAVSNEHIKRRDKQHPDPPRGLSLEGPVHLAPHGPPGPRALATQSLSACSPSCSWGRSLSV